MYELVNYRCTIYYILHPISDSTHSTHSTHISMIVCTSSVSSREDFGSSCEVVQSLVAIGRRVNQSAVLPEVVSHQVLHVEGAATC